MTSVPQEKPMIRYPRPLFFFAAMLVGLYATSAAAANFYDPPGRVARVSDTRGDVSYSPAGEDGWYDIRRNRPLVRGDRLWTDRGARAEFQVGSAAVRLDQDTSVEILELNDSLVQLDVSEGTINLRVRRLYAGQEFEIATPNIAFVVDRPGNYRIDVDPDNDHTTVVVWQGTGTAYGDRDHFPLRSGDAIRFYDNDLRDYDEYALPRQDGFDRYCSNRDNRLDRSLSLRYLGDDVIGYSDLDDYGDWRPVGSYGNVWFPRQTSSNWAPYRDGQWLWIDPWGWTWVDDAPWGFAPAHYGRWVNVSGRWGWIPGQRNYRPVYSPALVVFIGSHGWNLSISLGGDVSIGWFPLGPRDVYLPPYQTSRDYFSQVNVSNTVINNITINNVYNNYSSGTINVNQTNYANRRVADAVTAVPAKVFVNSQPVRAAQVRMDRDTLNRGDLARLAPIAPRQRSVVGTDANARVRPAREVLDRPVFVRTPPPASPRPFGERQQQLQQQPGQATATRPEPNPQDSARRNFRMIRGNAGNADARAAGPRQSDATTSPQAAPMPATPVTPLDRSIQTRRPHPQVPRDTRDQQDTTAPPTDPQAQARAAATAQAQARADAQARAQADAQSRAEAQQARADAQARAQADAQARAEAQQARADAQARAQADAQSRVEAQQARADAQARAQADAQARAEAQQARADAQARAQADAQARAEAQQARADAQSKAQADSQPPGTDRQPPDCLKPAEVEAMKRRAQRLHTDLPTYIPCDADGN
jgi:hypothetical protein